MLKFFPIELYVLRLDKCRSIHQNNVNQTLLLYKNCFSWSGKNWRLKTVPICFIAIIYI